MFKLIIKDNESRELSSIYCQFEKAVKILTIMAKNSINSKETIEYLNNLKEEKYIYGGFISSTINFKNRKIFYKIKHIKEFIEEMPSAFVKPTNYNMCFIFPEDYLELEIKLIDLIGETNNLVEEINEEIGNFRIGLLNDIKSMEEYENAKKTYLNNIDKTIIVNDKEYIIGYSIIED
jgi:hypothetical protein